MSGVLVDSNVILDVVTNDPQWEDWSSSMLARHAESGMLIINPIIYAEVSVGFERIEDHASSAGWDCVTKDGSFCWGELGKGNQCVSSTTCTPAQLKECLPGFPMCPKDEPAPTPVPEY